MDFPIHPPPTPPPPYLKPLLIRFSIYYLDPPFIRHCRVEPAVYLIWYLISLKHQALFLTRSTKLGIYCRYLCLFSVIVVCLFVVCFLLKIILSSLQTYGSADTCNSKNAFRGIRFQDSQYLLSFPYYHAFYKLPPLDLKHSVLY